MKDSEAKPNYRMVELILDEENMIEGVQAMGVVDNPAIMSNFLTFKAKEKKIQQFAAQDKEERILMGPAMIPNLPIYREDEEGPYYSYYTKDTVKKAMQLFFRNGRQNSATLNHEVGVGGLTIFESWIVEDVEKDKSANYGFEGIKPGTWMISMKVWDDRLWDEFIKTGVLKGFSIEGFFSDSEMKKQKDQMRKLMGKFSRLVYEKKKKNKSKA